MEGPWLDGTKLNIAVKVFLEVLNKQIYLIELLSNLVFESFWSCGDLAFWGGFNSVFERDACDDFGEVVKAA